MEGSIGRKPTQIEVEAMQAICKLQDENRELRLEVQRLREAISLSGVAKTMAQFVAEIERLEARVDAYDKYIRGYLTLGQLEEALKEAANPSPASHSQTSGGEK